MPISQAGAAPRSFSSRVNNGFLSLLILFISASIASAATMFVPAGGDLQAAVNAAAPGDTIVLEAGATYHGPLWLPKKTGDSYITIQSSRANEITGRVTPAQSGLLAKLRSTVGGYPAIGTTAGAHHYKLIGLDISTSTSTDLVYDLIRLGDTTQTDLASVPHHLILDRLWIHGFPTQAVQRGISLNSAETSILNSHISDIHAVGIDTQAICGWNGPGPYQILNNYLEAAGENIMFGGSPPAIRNLVPSNIEIRRNYFFKPLSWKVGHPTYAGIHWGVKNLLEFKNARNVIVDGNVFDGTWTDAQAGRAIVFTPRPSDSGLAAVVEDITFSNNIVRNVGSGVLLLGADEAPAPTDTRLRRVSIVNNIFEIDGPQFGSNGFFLTVINATDQVTIDHNTAIQTGNIIGSDYAPNTGFIYRNNITRHNQYGIFGAGMSPGNGTINFYFPGSLITANAIAKEVNAPWNVELIYPAGNYYPATLSAVGFVDAANGNYRLASWSPYKNAGTDLKDVGVDVDALNAAQAGGSQPLPTPSPTPTPTPTPAPAPASLQFSSTSYTTNESSGVVTITVTRTGSTALTATVQFSTSDGTASNAGDYTNTFGTVTFAPGESTKNFNVLITNDVTNEPTETFNIRLSSSANATLGNPALTTVSIVDNDKKTRRHATTLDEQEVNRKVLMLRTDR